MGLKNPCGTQKIFFEPDAYAQSRISQKDVELGDGALYDK